MLIPEPPTDDVDALGAFRIKVHDGGEAFTSGGRPLPFRLVDFWRWSSSDILGNALRGVIAEYLVAQALGVAAGVRAEWDACDVRTPEGIRVEVKSAAYLQSWAQKRLSPLSFGIQQAYGWDAASNVTADLRCRSAHVYVFCVLAHRDKLTVDPLNVDQWEFYVLPTSALDSSCVGQKKITMNSLLKLHPERVKYDGLAHAIHAAAGT